MRLPTDFSRDDGRDAQDDLDKELNKYSFTHHNQLFDDSPNKSELNQFGDFSGSHSQFDSGSIERGMANLEKSTDFSFKSKSAMPPMSTLSSLSSHTDSPRKARSEGGRRSSSFNRFSPMSTRKVTALGMHESESEYSPSKYYQPARTPHAASRMAPQSTRKVSPKSFKNTATLFNDLGLDDSVRLGNTTTMPAGQSFRLPRDIPDLSTLLTSSRKSGHKAIESVPVSEDNQKLFVALQELQATVDSLERQHHEAQEQLRKMKDALRRAEENVKAERQRANFAEEELKQYLSSNAKSAGSDSQIKALEARNATLISALNGAKKDLESRTLELELAREEAVGIEEECNGATERLAKALENVTRLTLENEALKAQIRTLQAQLASARAKDDKARDKQSVEDKISERLRRQASSGPATQPSKKSHTDPIEEHYSDEGIEVSKSILNDSEIEDLSREVEDTRRRNAKKAANKRQTSAQTQRKTSTQKSARQQSVERHAQPKRGSVESHPKATAARQRPRKSPQPVQVSISSDDDTYLSSDVDDVESELDLSSDEEDTALASTAEDEPSQILYRRKPTSRKAAGASKLNVQKVISELSQHDIAKCTICSRKAVTKGSAAKGTSSTQRKTPGTQGAGDASNATIRPSQPPIPALHSVLGGLEDEFRHLKIKYHSQNNEYNTLDPCLGKKKRKLLAEDLRATIEALEGKADQIYSIFDVLEAAATGAPLDYEGAAATPHIGRQEWICT